jgi:hypothetical protein
VHQQGCWVDVFELTRFRGRRRRLFGPARFPSVRGRFPASGVSIESLQIGPGAFVRFFRSQPADNTPETVLWLGPDSMVKNILQLKLDADVDSIEVLPSPPAPDDAG